MPWSRGCGFCSARTCASICALYAVHVLYSLVEMGGGIINTSSSATPMMMMHEAEALPTEEAAALLTEEVGRSALHIRVKWFVSDVGVPNTTEGVGWIHETR
jgi:hypothetical protein